MTVAAAESSTVTPGPGFRLSLEGPHDRLVVLVRRRSAALRVSAVSRSTEAARDSAEELRRVCKPLQAARNTAEEPAAPAEPGRTDSGCQQMMAWILEKTSKKFQTIVFFKRRRGCGTARRPGALARRDSGGGCRRRLSQNMSTLRTRISSKSAAAINSVRVLTMQVIRSGR